MRITGDEWYELGERLLALHERGFTGEEIRAIGKFLALAKNNVEDVADDLNDE